MTRRIALFGGSFNPPHVGHEDIIRWLAALPYYEAVWVLPVVNHAFNKDLAPYEDREALVRALVADLPRVQIARRDEVYTADLLYNLSRERPAFKFDVVLGADILHDCGKWYRWADVLPHAVFVTREGYPAPDGVVVHPITMRSLSSTELRGRMVHGDPVSVDEVPERVQQAIAARGLYRAP